MDFAFVPPQTPALIIDQVALIANIRRLQSLCDAGGVALRPHGKMHKCSTIAHLQRAAGAIGLCCQTVGEAEAFVRGGVGDLLVSAPIAPWGAARIAALVAEKGTAIAVVCDSEAQIDRLGAAALIAGVTIGALVDINIGMHRVGCTPAEVPALAARIAATAGLRYRGVQAYFGHIQHITDGRAEANARGTAILKTIVEALRAAGLPPETVTGGGSGTYSFDIAGGVFTELQCGSYAVMDVEYEDSGGPDGDWPFRPALFVATTIISARHKTHVTADAGLKALGSDVAARVVYGGAPGSLWRALGDEHAAIIHPSALGIDVEAIDADDAIAWPEGAPREGDTVWLQPGHVDPTINLYDAFYAVAADGSFERWPIDARRVSP